MLNLESNRVSIVIPAHNEVDTISECLRAIFKGAAPDELETIVVCNGCTDRTASVARSFGERVAVYELTRASKPAAINFGDAAASHYPRFFVDADVRVSAEAIRQVTSVLRSGEALIAAPELRVDTTGCSFAVRAYYQIWTRLPWVSEQMVGSGVYAVSETGRRRFSRFPKEGADDTWISGHFRPEERRSVTGAEFTVPASPSLLRLIRRRSRIYATNRLIASRLPYQKPPEHRTTRALIRLIAREPALLPASAVYSVVSLVSKIRAAYVLRTGSLRWESDRDQS